MRNWDDTIPIRFGGNAPLFHGVDSTAARGFFRLRFSDNANDFDGDRISNAQEAANGTDPWSAADSDFDGLPDDWERAYLGNLSHDSDELAAGGMILGQKFELGLDPNKADYDDDGVEDGADHFPTDERRSESIPVRCYGAIDLSEGLAGFPPVQQVALDDANQVAFAGWADLYSSESVRVAVWRDGTIVEDFGSPTSDFIPAFINATGTLLGLTQAPEEPYAAYRVGLLTSAGVSTFELPALYYYTVPGDPYNGQRIFLDSVFLTGFS